MSSAPYKINGVNFSVIKPEKEYDRVEFSGCDFSGTGPIEFEDCIFRNCNFSNVNFRNFKLMDLKFTDCKLVGANFSQAKDFGFCVTFENCQLDYASFDRRRMNKSVFRNCRLHSANFTMADLSKCSLVDCDLAEALFDGTNLSGVDFTSCRNFLIDPEKNNIKKAKFLSQDLPGLLYRHDIVIV